MWVDCVQLPACNRFEGWRSSDFFGQFGYLIRGRIPMKPNDYDSLAGRAFAESLAYALPPQFAISFGQAFAALCFEWQRKMSTCDLQKADGGTNDSCPKADSGEISGAALATSEVTEAQLVSEALRFAGSFDIDAQMADPSARRMQLIRDRLTLYLHRRKMTKKDLAGRLGKDPAQISRIFANPGKRQLGLFIEIAEALHVNLADILQDVTVDSEIRRTSTGQDTNATA